VIGPERDPSNPDHQRTLEQWRIDFEPQTVWEEELLSEVVSLGKQNARADELLNREMTNFGAEIDGTQIGSVDGVFAGSLTLPIDAPDLPIERGWHCERLIIRTSATQDNIQAGANRGPMLDQSGQPRPGYQLRAGTNNNAGKRLEVEAELGFHSRQAAALPDSSGSRTVPGDGRTSRCSGRSARTRR